MEPICQMKFGLDLEAMLAMPFDRLANHLSWLGGEVDEFVLELAFAAIPQWRIPE